ncbi:MAG TPA: group 1 truncated hemoglobin [Saprospiraceae bacterium]|nr:group 1 truncated hemoglobin [Saprospiraceae bacterium]HMQ85261.1 group 1 truncated hemoglobin [Saprospiraceae bacterium]
MNFRILSLMVAVALLLFVSCKNEDDTVDPTPTLYEKLGGSDLVADPANPGQMIEAGRLGLRSVVDSTIFVIAADPELSPFFATLLSEVGSGNLTNFAVLSKNLTDFFCVATGAENFTYSGLDMVKAHDPAQNPRMAMKSDDADFDQFIADVVIGATQNGVPNDLIAEVGALIETLRPDVVQN